MKSPVSELESLLREEREALLHGRFDKLSNLANSKERLLRIIPHNDPDLPRVACILGRVQELNRIARDALVAAREKPCHDFAGYNAAGQRESLSRPTARLVHKV